MATKKLEDKVKALQRLPDNKTCFDCGHLGIQTSICLPFGIFICTPCSGLHRQFNGHQVYTISMTTFTEKLVTALESQGNAVNRALYLARFTEKSVPRDGSNPESIKRFIKMCFVDKAWVESPQKPVPPQSPAPSSANKLHAKPTPTSQATHSTPSKVHVNDSVGDSYDFPDFINPSSLEQPRVSHVQKPTPRTTESHPDHSAHRSAPPTPTSTHQAPRFQDINASATSFSQLQFPGARSPSDADGALAGCIREQSRHFAAMLLKNPNLTPAEFFTIIMSAAQITSTAMAKKQGHTPQPRSGATSAHYSPARTPQVSSSPSITPMRPVDDFQADFGAQFGDLSISNQSQKKVQPTIPEVSEQENDDNDDWAAFAQPTTSQPQSKSKSTPALAPTPAPALNIFDSGLTFGSDPSYNPNSNPFQPQPQPQTQPQPQPQPQPLITNTTSSQNAQIVDEDDEDDIFGEAVMKTKAQTPAPINPQSSWNQPSLQANTPSQTYQQPHQQQQHQQHNFQTPSGQPQSQMFGQNPMQPQGNPNMYPSTHYNFGMNAPNSMPNSMPPTPSNMQPQYGGQQPQHGHFTQPSPRNSMSSQPPASYGQYNYPQNPTYPQNGYPQQPHPQQGYQNHQYNQRPSMGAAPHQQSGGYDPYQMGMPMNQQGAPQQYSHAHPNQMQQMQQPVQAQSQPQEKKEDDDAFKDLLGGW